MRVPPSFAALTLMLAVPAAALAGPADSLSLTRAAPVLEQENQLGGIGIGGVWLPLLAISALAVLVIVIADDSVDTQEPVSA